MPDRNDLLRQWRESQKTQYLLNREEVKGLFSLLEEKLINCGCDHTLKHTSAWISRNKPEAQTEDIIMEIRDMGGYCDCEVLMNCYEDYFD